MGNLHFHLFFILLFTIVESENTTFIYQGFNEDNLLEKGATVLKPTGLLRLTNKSNYVTGHAFYQNPIQLYSQSRNASSFSTNFVFEIVPPRSGSGGYGLAFFFSPSTDLPGAEHGHYLGIFNQANAGKESNHIFLVEFDTVNGHNEGVDARGNHIGIGINDIISKASEPAAFYVNDTDRKEDFDLEKRDSQAIQAWVEYDGEKKIVNVTVSPVGMDKPIKPLISYGVDLTKVLQGNSYVGFSASTGDKASSHYILGWSFKLNSLIAPKLNVSDLPRAPRERDSTVYDARIIALIASLCGVTVLLLGLLGYFLWSRRNKDDEVLEDWEIDCPHRFCYKDLYAATKGFNDSEVVGVGGFGAVYKGVCNGNAVAVKKITRNSLQGMREFAAEIESLGRLRHKNLVHLQGWCKQKKDLLLVYEYIPNGSLDTLLFHPKNGFVLSWEQRFNIIRGVTAGLLYLHEEWEQVVIHRDVKSSNVLIDAEMNARLGDFGLARLYAHGGASQTTNVVGTIGYIAPELTRTGKASASSDVFAFGILLLELATGKHPLGSRNFLLVEWVRNCQQLGQILETVDPLLGSNYDRKEIELVLSLGLICSHQRQVIRPTMRQVMRYLNGDDLLPVIDDWSTDDYSHSDFGSQLFQGISSDTFRDSASRTSMAEMSAGSMRSGR